MLSYFTNKFKPRPQQEEALLALEAAWNSHDVFIVRAPVGSGKSAIAECIAKFCYDELSLRSSIITPTNVLVQQYLKGCDGLTSAPSRGSFGKDDRAWAVAKAAFKDAPIKVANYYTYLALRAYSPILIADEAHKLIPMLTELDGVKLWKHLDNYPDYIPTILHFIQWAQDEDNPRVTKMLDKLISHPTLYTMIHERAMYRGHERELLDVRPLSPKNSKPVLWPGCVKKIILMSATIGIEDVHELGLDRRRIKLIDVSSPIPPERRPIVYDPIGDMGRKHQNKNIPKLVEYIEDKLYLHEGEKGLIHCTYGLAAKLRTTRLVDNPKIIWHTNLDKSKKLKQWLNSPPEEGKILMACGLTEGLDIKGDLGRWQIIAKLMLKDLSDIAVAEKMRQSPDWYANETIKELVQAAGRICRGEDDFGVTFITDAAFARLYTNHRDKFPISFREALR